MIDKPAVDWFALSPELALLAATGLLLMVAVLVPRAARRFFGAAVCAGGFVTAFVLAVVLDDRSPHAQAVIGGAIVRDR